MTDNKDFYSFFFYSDENISNFYKQNIVSVLYEEARDFSFGSCLYEGDLLLIKLSSKISNVHVSKEEGSSSLTYGYSIEPDKNLLRSLSGELYNSLFEKHCTFNDSLHPIHFATRDMYVISVSNINYDIAKQINNKMRIYNNYFGMAQCDLKNPMHTELFINYMIQDYYFHNKVLYYKEYYGDPAVAYPYWIEDTNVEIKPINEFDYDKIVPQIEKCQDISKNGESFLRLYKQKKINHSWKVASNLLNLLFVTKELNIEFRYNVDDKFNFKNVTISKDKLVKYALNKDHPVGGNKAILFERLLGITAEDWEYLSAQIIEGLLNGKVNDVRPTQYGVKYYIDVQVLGLNGVSKTVRTAWIADEEANISLTTTYILELKEQKEQPVNDLIYVDKKLKSKNEYYDTLYKLAHKKAMEELEKTIPVPLYIKETKEVIMQGTFGWASIVIDGRCGLANWLRKNNIGYKHYKKGWVISAPNSTESLDKQVAYIETFSKILTVNNIGNSIEKEID